MEITNEFLNYLIPDASKNSQEYDNSNLQFKEFLNTLDNSKFNNVFGDKNTYSYYNKNKNQANQSNKVDVNKRDIYNIQSSNSKDIRNKQDSDSFSNSVSDKRLKSKGSRVDNIKAKSSTENESAEVKNSIIINNINSALEEIAKLLDIPVESVQNALINLGLQPQQLTIQENLVEFVKNALGSESAMDLLNVDKIKDKFASVKDILDDLSSELTELTQLMPETTSNLTNIDQSVESLLEQNSSDSEKVVYQSLINSENLNKDVPKNLQSSSDNQRQTNNENNINTATKDNNGSLNEFENLETLETQKAKIIQENLDVVDFVPNENVSFETDKNYVNQHAKKTDVDNLSDFDYIEMASNTTTKTNNTESSFAGQGFANQNFSQNQQNNPDDNTNIDFKLDDKLNIFNGIDSKNVNFTDNIQKTESARSINQLDIIKQISDKIKIGVKNDITEVNFTLRPDHLGDVVMKVSTQNGAVTAQFIAENQRVKEIIEDNFNTLRDMLVEQGIDVESIQVTLSQNNDNSSSNFEFNQNTQGNSQSSSSRLQSNDDLDIDLDESIAPKSYISDGEITNSQVNYSI